MVQTRKRLKTAVFESVLFNSDILVAIGPFLAAEEFVNLASTSRHFGGRTPTDPHANDNATQQNSLEFVTDGEDSLPGDQKRADWTGEGYFAKVSR